MIILYLNVERFASIDWHWIRKHKHYAMLLFGCVAGFFAGTVNVMVPILIIFALETD